jgi:hypothetical protein
VDESQKIHDRNATLEAPDTHKNTILNTMKNDVLSINEELLSPKSQQENLSMGVLSNEDLDHKNSGSRIVYQQKKH